MALDERGTLVQAQKTEIREALNPWLTQAAEAVISVWPDINQIDQRLADVIVQQPKCRMLYILSPEGVQLSSNIRQDVIESDFRNQDLSDRPYFTGNLPWRGITLSNVYARKSDRKLTITALFGLNEDERLLGFIAADFLLDDLDLLTSRLLPQTTKWTQFRGDRAIRSTLFLQKRIASVLDQHHDSVNASLVSLMQNRGVFHVLLHFSSARAIIWLLDDPYRYQLMSPDELIQPESVMAYPRHAYSDDAVVAADKLPEIFERFKQLRNADENIYLRSASINVMNGIIGLTFSCDGSHYMSANEFLERGIEFWFGKAGA